MAPYTWHRLDTFGPEIGANEIVTSPDGWRTRHAIPYRLAWLVSVGMIFCGVNPMSDIKTGSLPRGGDASALRSDCD